MKVNIGISDKNRKAVANELNIILANEMVLFTKLTNAHWNLVGPDFHSVHEFLDDLYHAQLEVVDTVAEQIRALDHFVPATLKDYLELTTLEEKLPKKNNSQGYYKLLLKTYDAIIRHLRDRIGPFAEEYKAEGMSDYITGLMNDHEKTAWMIRAHLDRA